VFIGTERKYPTRSGMW